MGTQVLSDNDPVIQVTLNYPDNVAAPTDTTWSCIYTASVVLKNTSNLPLASSDVKVTLDDNLFGYDVELWNSDTSAPTSVVTLDTGALVPGAESTKSFKFRVKKSLPMPPAPSGDTHMIFHVMPAYEIKYNHADGFVSNTNLAVADNTGLNGVSDWTTNPPGFSQESTDPVIGFQHSFWGNITCGLQGWGSGAWVVAKLQVTNKAPVPIAFLKYQIAVDDTLAQYDLKCQGESGGWGQTYVSDDQGTINPGQTTHPYDYWLSIFHIATTEEEACTGTGYLQIAPWYKVQYQQSDSLNKTIPVAVG